VDTSRGLASLLPAPGRLGAHPGPKPVQLYRVQS
jgi:hypothetical protein